MRSAARFVFTLYQKLHRYHRLERDEFVPCQCVLAHPLKHVNRQVAQVWNWVAARQTLAEERDTLWDYA